jgi:3-hydroxyisobutyrate dehydrogenase/glyoxylate/succinic semialdehyde reductase
MRIGFMGLGLMGSRMARRLLGGDRELIVWNRTREKAEALAKEGARLAANPAELGRTCEVTVTMLLDEGALLSVLEGPEGWFAGLEEARSGGEAGRRYFLDMSTIGPAAARRIGERMGQRGVRFVDAPVLGSIGPAAEGQLLILAGGDPEDLEALRPVLGVLGRQTIHAGGVGQGNALKMVANMMLARMVEALGEILRLGRGQGLEVGVIHEMLQAGALRSPMWNKLEVYRQGTPPLHFPLRHMRKDLELIAQSARMAGVELPVAEVVRKLYGEAAGEGCSDEDYSFLALWMLAKSGLTI